MPQLLRFRAAGSFHCFPKQFCKATLRLRGSHVVLTTCNVEVRTSLLNSAYSACFQVEIYYKSERGFFAIVNSRLLLHMSDTHVVSFVWTSTKNEWNA